MRSYLLPVCLVFILILWPGAVLMAQPDEIDLTRESGEIVGSVDYCGPEGSENIQVFIPGKSFMAMTDSQGRFALSYVPVGTWTLKFVRRGQQLGTKTGVPVIRRQQTILDNLNDPVGPLVFCTDLDGDGFAPDQDCDDTNPSVNPLAAELCNDGVDNNCDGVTDEDCPECSDFDSDGYYAQAFCDGFPDCNDNNSAVNPGAQESCGDGVDNNCDGRVDEDDAFNASTFYPDFDEDGYGDATQPVKACVGPEGYVETGGDCNDDDAAIHPGAVEKCADGVDNNCDGIIETIPPGCTDRACTDTEVSLFETCMNECVGDPVACGQYCSTLEGLTTECRSAIFALGICAYGAECTDLDLLSGSICAYDSCPEEWADVFGLYVPTECTPGDVRQCGSGIGACEPGSETCSAEGRWGACLGGIGPSPEEPDHCSDGEDNDCNGLVDDCDPCNPNPCTMPPDPLDEDGDGYAGIVYEGMGICGSRGGFEYDCSYPPAQGPDCDDGNPMISPSAAEICDGIDNDCDGMIDEGTAVEVYLHMPFEGTLSGPSQFDPPLACYQSEFGNGADAFFSIFLEPGIYQFEALVDTEGTDTIMFLTSDGCGGTVLDCNDDVDFPYDLGSFIEYTVTSPGTIFIVVDSYAGFEGPFTLLVTGPY